MYNTLPQTMRKQLLDKFRAEKDKMPPEKRTLVLTHFPRFETCTQLYYNPKEAPFKPLIN